jgi:hypothetical protein
MAIRIITVAYDITAAIDPELSDDDATASTLEAVSVPQACKQHGVAPRRAAETA